MQYQKLTPEQKSIRNWRKRRNHVVCQLLEKDTKLTRHEALTQANHIIRTGSKIRGVPRDKRKPRYRNHRSLHQLVDRLYTIPAGTKCARKQLGTQSYLPFTPWQDLEFSRYVENSDDCFLFSTDDALIRVQQRFVTHKPISRQPAPSGSVAVGQGDSCRLEGGQVSQKEIVDNNKSR